MLPVIAAVPGILDMVGQAGQVGRVLYVVGAVVLILLIALFLAVMAVTERQMQTLPRPVPREILERLALQALV